MMNNWFERTGVSKAQVRDDIQIAVSLGLISRDNSIKKEKFLYFKIETELIDAIRWDQISMPHYQVLNSIVRLYGTNPFTKAEIANATGINPNNIAYNLRILKRFSVISLLRGGAHGFRYHLSVPIADAINALQVRGFTQFALVG